jgi:hypothetical protein
MDAIKWVMTGQQQGEETEGSDKGDSSPNLPPQHQHHYLRLKDVQFDLIECSGG